jgi:spore coat protein CotH
VPEGRKRSFNVTLDNVNNDQNIGGYNSLNLLNSHTDPTFLRSVLYLQAAREYLPAAKANWVRVVINGESWGVYVNVQQVDKPFLAEWYKTKNGTRWKVPGSPNGRGGLEFLGTDIATYKQIYEIKGDDNPKAWAALMEFTRILNQTPPESLEQALSPILDVDNVLRFLAVEMALVNNDGYWVRASDYNIYLDTKGRFHVVPHDTNETFPVRGGGFGGGGRGFGRGGDALLDPLVGITDAAKPLRSKLLAVPSLRARYLAYVRQVATKWLDWNTLQPVVTRSQALIAAEVKADTKRLDDYSAFEQGGTALKTFADERRQYLLSYAPPQ